VTAVSKRKEGVLVRLIDRSTPRIGLIVWCAVFLCVACSSRIEESAVYERDYETMFRSGLSTTAALSWEVTIANRESGFIQAKVPMNPRTFGSLVTIEIRRISPTATRLQVSSTSPQLLDWGKNSANTREFLEKLDSQAGPRK
jgi:hypothetical protein